MGILFYVGSALMRSGIEMKGGSSGTDKSVPYNIININLPLRFIQYIVYSI